MKKIKRPDWKYIFRYYKHELTEYAISELNIWFDQNIEPLNEIIENAIHVKGEYRKDRAFSDENGWAFDQSFATTRTTHKALLINIRPIKKETAEDVLRDIIDHLGPITNKQIMRALEVLGE